MSDVLNVSKLKKVGKTIRDGLVPLPPVDSIHFAEEVSELNRQIRSREYMPSPPVGYLGSEKNLGVTRFSPIINRRDTLVFYGAILALEKKLIDKSVGVYGAYKSIPEPLQPKMEIGFNEILQLVDSLPYAAQGNLNPQKWFKEWTTFTQVIKLGFEHMPSNYRVAKTDIANFYDTINIDKLASKIMRCLISKSSSTESKNDHDIANLLITYLVYWDRSINGYERSSKGIPQEIISDASRILANFYLSEFDKQMIKFCVENEALYTRFADDIVIFAKSNKSLEYIIHKASRFLLAEGLNLNAKKTEFFSQKEFDEYRLISALDKISANDNASISSAIKKVLHMKKLGRDVRYDSLVRRIISINYTSDNSITDYAKDFVRDFASDVSFLSIFDEHTLWKRALIESNPTKFLNDHLSEIIKRPYAYPHANFLHLLRRKKVKLVDLNYPGVEAINKIEKSKYDSVPIKNFCLPATKAQWN